MSSDRREQPRVVLYRAEETDRGGGPYEVAYESVADALHFACRDLRTGRRRPLAIVEDGIVLMDGARIGDECLARDAEGRGVDDATGWPGEPNPSAGH